MRAADRVVSIPLKSWTAQKPERPGLLRVYVHCRLVSNQHWTLFWTCDARQQTRIRVLSRVQAHEFNNNIVLFGVGHAYCEYLLDLDASLSAGFLASFNEGHGGPRGPSTSCSGAGFA